MEEIFLSTISIPNIEKIDRSIGGSTSNYIIRSHHDEETLETCFKSTYRNAIDGRERVALYIRNRSGHVFVFYISEDWTSWREIFQRHRKPRCFCGGRMSGYPVRQQTAAWIFEISWFRGIGTAVTALVPPVSLRDGLVATWYFPSEATAFPKGKFLDFRKRRYLDSLVARWESIDSSLSLGFNTSKSKFHYIHFFWSSTGYRAN